MSSITNYCGLNTDSQPAQCVKEHWVKVAIVVGILVFAALSILAFTKIGVFHHVNSKAFGYGFVACGGAVFLAGTLGHFVNNYKQRPMIRIILGEVDSHSPDAIEEDDLAVVENSLIDLSSMEDQPNPDRYTIPTYLKPPPHSSASFSKTTEEKLAKQLKAAIKEGKQDTKAKPYDFLSKLQDASSAPMPTHSMSWAGSAEKQQRSREDAHFISEITVRGKKARLACVLDGHGDRGNATEHLNKHFSNKLEQALNTQPSLNDMKITNTLTGVFVDLDKEMQGLNMSGSCFTGALIMQNRVYIPNVGDSRTVLLRQDGTVFQLSEDADPNNARFKEGIERNGHFVSEETIYRVDGQLATARDIGINYVSGRPKITKIEKDIPDDIEQGKLGYKAGDLLIMASDGFWDVAKNSEAAQAIRAMQEKGDSLAVMSACLVEAAKQAGSKDDITVVIVRL